ncbi:MAG: DUF1836 domain-containing protein [Clostridiales bacterium]|nr:DUF1836 domain-containing protein [Clostridiales bacterium]
MHYDKDLIAHKLRRWEQFLQDYKLPDWDDIPDFGLYMDQVMLLLTNYLDFVPTSVEKLVTTSTINNYVRLKVMPAPVKKKYYRVHIAYLLIILTLKQSLSISDIQQIIPPDSPRQDVQSIYSDYARRLQSVALFFTQEVRNAARDLLSPEEGGAENATEMLLIQSALVAGFSRILAEKLARLRDADPQQVLEAEEDKRQHKEAR